MPAQKTAKHMRVANTAGAAVGADGNEYLFHPGQLFSSTHPLVRACPMFFDDAEDHARPEIESATAAPGEVRGE